MITGIEIWFTDSWRLSDIIICMLIAVLNSNLLLCILFLFRKPLEHWLSMRQTDFLLKYMIVYILAFMPLFTLLLGSSIYGNVSSYYSDNILKTLLQIKRYSLGRFTAYGNSWGFACLLALWLFGFLLLWLNSFRKERKLIKTLKEELRLCEDSKLLDLKRKLEEELGLKSAVPLYVCGIIDVPFVFGTLHQVIVLPNFQTDSDGLQFILRHELLHCKKLDNIYRRLLFLICTIYWFNPFLRRLAWYYSDINEMTCDEQIMEKSGRKERILYARTLATMKLQNEALNYAVSLAGHSESQMERRMKRIVNDKRRRNRIAAALLTGLFAAVCPVTTVVSATGVANLQDALVRQMNTGTEEQLSEDILAEETDSYINEIEIVSKNLLRLQEAVMIEEEIREDSIISIGEVKLSAGDTVTVYLRSENVSDKIRAGYIDQSDARTYVTSADGCILHEFTVPEDGTYTVFISSPEPEYIRVIGSVTVIS